MSKYKNKLKTIDGITFHSRKEANYYQELKFRKMGKDIVDFVLQPKFELQEGFRLNGKKIRPITYKADFLIHHNDGTKEVVDVKGYRTEVFNIKWKMLKYLHKDEENIKFTLA